VTQTPPCPASLEIMRTLVITSCTAEKRGDGPDPASADELADPERRRQAEARLAAFACPAEEMYTGTHHRLVVQGVHAVWQRWGRAVLDLSILSAGYGLVDAREKIVPYDVSFDEFDEKGVADWVDGLRIRERAAALLREYELVFYLLNRRHLAALGLPLDVPEGVQQIVLTGQDSLDLVPSAPNLYAIVAAEKVAAQRWHIKAPHVCGFLFGRLCNQVVAHGPAVLEWLCHHPQDTELLFYKRACWRPQLSLWQNRDGGIPVPVALQ
jgi:hypothetical protein